MFKQSNLEKGNYSDLQKAENVRCPRGCIVPLIMKKVLLILICIQSFRNMAPGCDKQDIC